MRLYQIRHGESQANLDRLWSGWNDVPLTQKGFEDAKRAGEYIKDIKFDKIFASDLSRAQNTATTAIPNCQFEVTPLLREINVGNLVGTPFTSEHYQRVEANGYVDFEGESLEDMKNRVKSFMNLIKTSQPRTVAAFTHAGFLRTFLDVTVGIRLPRQNVLCRNCAIAVFEYDNKTWKLHSWINLE